MNKRAAALERDQGTQTTGTVPAIPHHQPVQQDATTTQSEEDTVSDDGSGDFVIAWDASVGDYVRRKKVRATLNLSSVAEATHSQSVRLDTVDAHSISTSELDESDIDIDSQSSDFDDWQESAEARLSALLRVASRRPLPPARGPMIPANRDQSSWGIRLRATMDVKVQLRHKRGLL